MRLDPPETILLYVEAAEPVIWTKPEAIKFDPDGDPPALGGHYGDGFVGVFLDGTPRYISKEFAREHLRKMVLVDDGEDVPLPGLSRARERRPKKP